MSEAVATDLNLIRWISDTSGRVFDPQLITLKRTALLIGGSKVTIALSGEAKSISYTFEGRNRKAAEQMLREATAAILGPSWGVEIIFEGNHGKQQREGGKTPKRKRTRRLQKVRRKR